MKIYSVNVFEDTPAYCIHSFADCLPSTLSKQSRFVDKDLRSWSSNKCGKKAR